MLGCRLINSKAASHSWANNPAVFHWAILCIDSLWCQVIILTFLYTEWIFLRVKLWHMSPCMKRGICGGPNPSISQKYYAWGRHRRPDFEGIQCVQLRSDFWELSTQYSGGRGGISRCRLKLTETFPKFMSTSPHCFGFKKIIFF